MGIDIVGEGAWSLFVPMISVGDPSIDMGEAGSSVILLVELVVDVRYALFDAVVAWLV